MNGVPAENDRFGLRMERWLDTESQPVFGSPPRITRPNAHPSSSLVSCISPDQWRAGERRSKGANVFEVR